MPLELAAAGSAFASLAGGAAGVASAVFVVITVFFIGAFRIVFLRRGLILQGISRLASAGIAFVAVAAVSLVGHSLRFRKRGEKI